MITVRSKKTGKVSQVPIKAVYDKYNTKLYREEILGKEST
jgi:hypothetical protein